MRYKKMSIGIVEENKILRKWSLINLWFSNSVYLVCVFHTSLSPAFSEDLNRKAASGSGQRQGRQKLKIDFRDFLQKKLFLRKKLCYTTISL